MNLCTLIRLNILLIGERHAEPLHKQFVSIDVLQPDHTPRYQVQFANNLFK